MNWPLDERAECWAGAMSIQRSVLPQVVDYVRGQVPGCGILLTGSVRYGYERPTSDIDLLMAVADKNQVQLPGATQTHETDTACVTNFHMEERRVEVVYFEFSYLEEVEEKPWRSYTIYQAEILHDPDGRLQRCQSALGLWFRCHPRITEVWEKQLASCRQYVAEGRPPNRSDVLSFPMWEDFAEYIDGLVEQM